MKVNKLLWFCIGVGLGYCVFFKPKPVEQSKGRIIYDWSNDVDNLLSGLDLNFTHSDGYMEFDFDRMLRDAKKWSELSWGGSDFWGSETWEMSHYTSGPYYTFVSSNKNREEK